jgi:polyhydroxyalkanoate synthesis regulator phasin
MPYTIEEKAYMARRINEIADELRRGEITLEAAEKEIDELIKKLNEPTSHH